MAESLLLRGAFARTTRLLDRAQAIARRHGYRKLELKAAAQRAPILMAPHEHEAAQRRLHELLALDPQSALPPKRRRILIHAL